MRLSAALALAASIALAPWLTAPAAAQEAGWKIVKWNGEVHAYGARGDAITPLDQATLPPGARLTTGASSRAMMTRGGDTVVISENSVLQVPTSTTPGVTPTIVQNRGTVTYEIEPRAVQHFQVETPHLAAVVKGTAFTVALSPGSSRVDVVRGTVEVQDFKSGQTALIEANRWAASSPPGLSRLVVGGEGWLPVIRQGAVRKASLAVEEEPARAVSGPSPATDQAAAQPAAQVASRAGGNAAEGDVTRTVTPKNRGFLARITDPSDGEYMFGVLFTAFTGFVVTVMFAIRNRRRIERQHKPRT